MIIPPEVNYIKIASLNISFYGLIMALSVFVAFVLIEIFSSTSNKLKIDLEIVYDFSPYMLLIAFLGARLYYVILNYSYYVNNLSEIFKVWHGGLSIHGGIFAGIIFLYLYFKIKKQNYLNYADIFALVLPVSQAIGRWGNFFNVEAFGKPCEYFWCMTVPEKYRPFEYLDYNSFHPTFLYESIFNIFVFIILLLVYKYSKNLKYGTVFLLYLFLYSVGRFFIEQIRIDATSFIFNMPVPQFISLVIIMVSTYFLVKLYRKD